MEYVIYLVLALAAVIFFVLYQRGVKERNHLTILMLRILLDEKTYHNRREGLKNLVSGMDANNAMELSTKVMLSAQRLANQVASGTVLTAHALLWEMKKGSGENTSS